MILALILGACLLSFAVLARLAHDAPVGEELDGIGFVSDPEKLRRFRQHQDAGQRQSNRFGSLSVGGEISHSTHTDLSRTFRERNHGA